MILNTDKKEKKTQQIYYSFKIKLNFFILQKMSKLIKMTKILKV